MKKRNLFALLLIVSLSAGHLTGCGSVESGDTQPSETTQAPEATQSAAENPIGVEDTYWTAVSCFNEETSLSVISSATNNENAPVPNSSTRIFCPLIVSISSGR